MHILNTNSNSIVYLIICKWKVLQWYVCYCNRLMMILYFVSIIKHICDIMHILCTIHIIIIMFFNIHLLVIIYILFILNWWYISCWWIWHKISSLLHHILILLKHSMLVLSILLQLTIVGLASLCPNYWLLFCWTHICIMTIFFAFEAKDTLILNIIIFISC